MAPQESSPHTETATLAGGCFWGVEELISQQPGVLETRVGYTGGTLQNPAYPDVKSGETGHAECIQVVFNTTQTTFKEILLWRRLEESPYSCEAFDCHMGHPRLQKVRAPRGQYRKAWH